MSDSRSESLTRRIWGATWRIGAFILLFALCMTPLVFPLTRLAPADGSGFGPRLQAMFDGAGLLADRAGLPLAALSGVLNVATQDLLIAGFAYLVLAPRFGSRAAAILLSILFVGLHAGALTGADAAIPALNLFLAGLLLISCRVVTGSLWLTMGVHFAWNYLQGPVLGLAVTGQSLTENPPVLTLSGPNWITGGAFGFEGGVAATAATAAGIATVWLVGRNPVIGSKSASGH